MATEQEDEYTTIRVKKATANKLRDVAGLVHLSIDELLNIYLGKKGE